MYYILYIYIMYIYIYIYMWCSPHFRSDQGHHITLARQMDLRLAQAWRILRFQWGSLGRLGRLVHVDKIYPEALSSNDLTATEPWNHGLW